MRLPRSLRELAMTVLTGERHGLFYSCEGKAIKQFIILPDFEVVLLSLAKNIFLI